MNVGQISPILVFAVGIIVIFASSGDKMVQALR